LGLLHERPVTKCLSHGTAKSKCLHGFIISFYFTLNISGIGWGGTQNLLSVSYYTADIVIMTAIYLKMEVEQTLNYGNFLSSVPVI
jgi:hypothetical protein